MRWPAMLSAAVCACSAGNIPRQDATPPGDAGGDGASPGIDGGSPACSIPAELDAASLGLSPPDGGLQYSAGPVPASDRQSAGWVPTGAAGCDGLVPPSVSPRLSWTAPSAHGSYCFEGDPVVDGDGDLAFTFDGPNSSFPRVFFPSDGSAGLMVDGNEFIVASRPRGFYTLRADYASSGVVESARAVGPEGVDQGFVRGAVAGCGSNTPWADP